MTPALAAALLGALAAVVPQDTSTPDLPFLRPNVVLVIADDVGVDLVGAYGAASVPACTPNVDRLASTGVLFRNAWSNPVCSPTRAQVLTGRHGFRTGIGRTVGNVVNGTGLAEAERTLPEALPGYASALVGKWHLGDPAQGTLHPNASGFGSFAGSLSNLQAGGGGSYSSWVKTVDGVQVQATTYATEDTIDDALAAVAALPEPWLLVVSFNACHTPVHDPPPHLCPAPAPCGTTACDNPSPDRPTPERVRAMMEVLDGQLGRLLGALDMDTLVVFLGDNGTDGDAVEPPYDPARAKGTLYQAGIRVPLIVSGAGVAAGECEALVTATDVFATVVELAGGSPVAEDSVSLVPYLTDPRRPSLRAHAYAEWFTPNNPVGPPNQHRRAVRDRRYKLIRRTGQPDELYDLRLDPLETNDLFPGLVPGSPREAAYLQLVAALADLAGS